MLGSSLSSHCIKKRLMLSSTESLPLHARALCLFGAPSQDNHRAFSDCQFNDDIKDWMRSSINVTCQTIEEPLRAELRAGSTSAKTPCNTGLMLSQTLPCGKNRGTIANPNMCGSPAHGNPPSCLPKAAIARCQQWSPVQLFHIFFIDLNSWGGYWHFLPGGWGNGSIDMNVMVPRQ